MSARFQGWKIRTVTESYESLWRLKNEKRILQLSSWLPTASGKKSNHMFSKPCVWCHRVKTKRCMFMATSHNEFFSGHTQKAGDKSHKDKSATKKSQVKIPLFCWGLFDCCWNKHQFDMEVRLKIRVLKPFKIVYSWFAIYAPVFDCWSRKKKKHLFLHTKNLIGFLNDFTKIKKARETWEVIFKKNYLKKKSLHKLWTSCWGRER